MSQAEPDLPLLFLERMQRQLGSDFDPFRASCSAPSPTAVRLNPAKPSSAFTGAQTIAWCPQGRYLDGRPSFTHDPLLHAGAYYVQEASSMFLSYALDQSLDLQQDLRVLDLSAAPGGKTTLIQALISPDSLLIANDPIGSRNKILRQNVSRWGGDNVWVTQNDPAAFQQLPEFFDVLVVDAPCSGEGLFRKDPSACSEWSPDHVLHCASRQKRILGDALSALKPGGFLIYSTCTFSEIENEENVKWLIRENGFEAIQLNLPASFGVDAGSTELPAYRFYPHRLSGEGFFLALLRKPGTIQARPNRKKNHRSGALFHPASTEDQRWLADAERYVIAERSTHSIAVPRAFLLDYQQLENKLYLTLSGLNLGKRYHGELKPSPELALSTAISQNIPTLALSREQSLQYLSHQPIEGLYAIPEGRSLACFEGQGLGWINHLATGQLRNNYPTAWRILKREEDLKA